MRGVPLPVQLALGVEAFAPARAPGHAESEVGLAPGVSRTSCETTELH